MRARRAGDGTHILTTVANFYLAHKTLVSVFQIMEMLIIGGQVKQLGTVLIYVQTSD